MSDPWKTIEYAKQRFAIACGLGDDVDARRAASSALDAAIRAAIAAPPAEAQPALQEYNECMKSEDDVSPLERLRFFCSLAMNGQDWCDSEPFFDALEAQIAALAGTKEGEK